MCVSRESPTSTSSSDATTLVRRRPPPTRSVLCEIEPLQHKSISEEIRAQKDLERLTDSIPILLNLRADTPKHVIRDILASLVDAGHLPPEALSEARNSLYGRGPLKPAPREADNCEDAFDENLSQTLPLPRHDSGAGLRQNYNNSHWYRNILGPGYIIPFARINGLNSASQNIVAIARLSSNCNLGVANDKLVRFVIVVLGPMRELKETKAPFELARTLSSVFQDDEFFSEARHCSDEHQLRDAIRNFLSREKDQMIDSQPESQTDRTFARTGKFAGGLIADIKRRYNPRVYKSDWLDGLTDMRSLLKFLSTIVWLFFAIIMPTIAFGALNQENTVTTNGSSGDIGVIETIVSQAIAGLAFAIFAGQPLTIVMTTAPLTVFIDVLKRWADALEIPFLPFYAWTGIWTAVILLILVVTDSCSIMKYCGHFTEEIFAALIAALFISEYVKPLIKLVGKINGEGSETEIFLLNFLLATGTFLIAMTLLNFRRSFLLKPIIRQLFSDFGVPIAIITVTGLRQIFDTPVEALQVPDQIGIVTSNGRSWVVPLFDIKVQWIFLAIVSGALLATLFFLDQNISSMLVNKSENKLKKGPGYNLDLVVVSVIVIVQSIFGMPWTHAALPHSPLHARQLADVEEYEEHGRRYERVIKSRETRITGFVTHVLVFLSIFAKDALNKIPLSVLWGFFLFLGFGTLDGNGLWDRSLLLFTQPEKYPPNHYVRRVGIKRIHLYTLIQVLLLVFLWFVKSNFYIGGNPVFNTGLLFPFVIAMFIPFRLFVLPRIFRPAELHALSMEEEVNISDTGITV